MERSHGNEPVEIALEDLHKQDAAICRAQDTDGLQSDKKSQKNGDATQMETSELGITHDTLKLMKEKEPTREDETQESLHISADSESSLKECGEIAEDKEVVLKADMQQKDESSFAMARGESRQESYVTHQECDVLGEDKLLESDGNATAQRTVGTSENILLVTDQKSVHEEENDATHQECDRCADELLLPNSETNLTERNEGLVEVPLQAVASNGTILVVSGESTETDQYLQENESGSESEESQVCMRTQQSEDEESDSPRRTCHHRTCNIHHHIMQQSRLPPLQEDPEPPPEPFEVEIEVNRRRILAAQLQNLPADMGDYMQRVRDRHIPPRMQYLCAEFQRRWGRSIFSIVIGTIITIAVYYLIDFLERRDGSNEYYNITFPLDNFDDNLNSSMTTLIPELSVTDLDVTASVADFHI